MTSGSLVAHCGGFISRTDSRDVTGALTEADRRTLAARLAALRQRPWRTRFAPAPTGHLHLGHAVNAVFVWSIARAFGGAVLVRIEDHDRQRSRPEYAASILADLRWLGLRGDNAACGCEMPLTQSSRLEGHGVTFRCRCSRRDLERQTGGAARYPGTCRVASIPGDEPAGVRLTMQPGAEVFSDLRHGAQVQDPDEQCGDLLLRDRLGQWTYQFAVVVDDMAQGIDVIVRGDDLLDSTGRQLALARQLGRITPPVYLHHPLITRADGSKLSKSDGDTGLRELRDAGWTPEGVLGHAAWLGGLQPHPKPLYADDVASLWSIDVA
jgi:glutamyl-Q tRNA(Asp) synthetase